MISGRVEMFRAATDRLCERLGPTDVVSDIFPFDFTHYYDREMGSPLYRQFVSFERRIAPDDLAEIKLLTNEMESQLLADASGPPRPVNLDPGYITPAKLVLASMKDFSHRVYLSRGVYAEVTLLHRHGRWHALEWTFPDYASPRYHPFLTAATDRLRRQEHEHRRTESQT